MLERLKKEYLDKEIKLLTLDQEMCELFETSSILEYDVEEMLEDGFVYMEDEWQGYNFVFEVVEFDSSEPLKTIVRVVDIDLV